MQSEYGICQQMTYCIQSYMHRSVFRLQMSYVAQTGLNYSSWCGCTVRGGVCAPVCVQTWRALVCTTRMFVCLVCACRANAYELYIHIQMLPCSSKALITNSQCLR